jgi:hypothetical protein
MGPVEYLIVILVAEFYNAINTSLFSYDEDQRPTRVSVLGTSQVRGFGNQLVYITIAQGIS